MDEKLKDKKPELKIVYDLEENLNDNPFGDTKLPVINAKLTYGYTYKDMFITADKIYPLSLLENEDVLTNIISIQKSIKEFEENEKKKINC